MVAEEELGVGALLHHDEHTTIDHEVYVGTEDVDDLHRSVHHHILLYVNEESVLCQHCVESGDAVLIGLSQLGVMFCHKLRMLLGIFRERCHGDAFGKVLLGLQGSAKLVVDDKVK